MVVSMKKFTLGLLLLSAIGLAAAYQFTENKMHKIRFLLGNNIVETAKASGIPEYGVSTTNGSIE